MASIDRVDGKWRARVRRKGFAAQCITGGRNGVPNTKAAVEAKAREVESSIDAGRAPVRLSDGVTVSRLIEAYRDMRDKARPIADTSTEHYTLRQLADGLGGLVAARLTPADLVGYCRARADAGAGPYTCNMDISKLGTALRYASAALGLPPSGVVAAARPLLTHLKLIGGGGKRERRPTDDELHELVAHLAAGRGLVYAEATLFAVATAMRAGELCRLRHDDIDRAKRLALIRDRKDPRHKAGNDQWVPLLPPAWMIYERQPVSGEGHVFPIKAPTLSKYFTEAVRALSIPDLHLHDMRHEGTSRLFEEGYSLEQVALVTGHKDWRNLKRYTQLKPESLHR